WDRPAEAMWAVADAPRGFSVPTWLHRIVLRCLHEGPNDRFPSMHELLRELDRDPGAVRRRWLAAAAALVGISALAIGAGRLHRPNRELCAGSEQALGGAWDEPTRARLQRAFAATGHKQSADVWNRTEQALGNYARAWATMRT